MQSKVAFKGYKILSQTQNNIESYRLSLKNTFK